MESSAPRKRKGKSPTSLFEDILPKLRPFQREALEFATKGTPYRRFHKNNQGSKEREAGQKNNKDETKNCSFEEPSLLGKGRILLADEMGLGKTVTALAIASYYYHQNQADWPLLVLCPASLRYTWPSEMEKFWPSLPPSAVHIVKGFSDVSWMDKVSSGEIKIVILTYSLLQQRSAVAQCLIQQADERNRKSTKKKKHIENGASPPQQSTKHTHSVYFPTIIADESHNLKQRDAQRTKMILPFLQASKHLLLLSGTPALARPVELYTQLHALAPTMFGKFHDFAHRYCDPKKSWVVYGGGRRFHRWDYSGAACLEELHAKLNNVMVRRLKQDVLDELPPKQRSVIPVTMSSDQSAACRQTMKDLEQSREAKDMHERSFQDKQHLMLAYQTTGLGKAAAVADYLMDWLDGSSSTDKIIVFAHHTKVLDHINAALYRRTSGFNRSSSQRKDQHIRIDGKVPSNERHKLVRQFQTQPHTRVALLSMTAAGVGLTLTAASTVLFGELHWTPGVLAQAEDRVHRLGQAKISQIMYCVCQDDKTSLDPILLNMLGRKVDTLLQVVDGGPSEGGRSTAFLEKASQAMDFNNSSHRRASSCEEQHNRRSGQEELTGFFANLNQSKRRQSSSDRPVARGSIESFFSKVGTPRAPRGEPTPTPLNTTKTPTSAQVTCSTSATSQTSPRAMEAQVDSVGDTTYWTCDVCTYASNRTRDARCVMCRSSGPKLSKRTTTVRAPHEIQRTRGQSNNLSLSAVVEWRCSSCTYANRKPRCPEDVYECSMCGHCHSLWEELLGKEEPLLEPSSFVTPTPQNKRLKTRVLSATTPVIQVDSSDDEETAVKQSGHLADVIEIPESPTEAKQETRSRLERNEQGYSWVFAVSKNSGRITVYNKQPESSTNISFDVNQVLSSESVDDFVLTQTRNAQRQKCPMTFSKRGLENIVKDVQQSCGRAIAGHRLSEDTKAFVTSYLRLRAVEQQAIKDSGKPFPPIRLAQAVAGILVRQFSVEQGTERYSGGTKERAYEKQGNGTALSQEERDVLNGRACAWCGKKLSRGHQKADATYCSQECAEEGRLRRGGKFASSQIRSAVFALEGGKCTLCGLDARALYEQILVLQPAERLNRLLDANWKLPTSAKGVENLLQNPKEGDFWQADHIQAVAEGGGSCGLENLRTLCVPCHQRETEKLRSRMKLSRNPNSAGGGTTQTEPSSSGKKRKQVDIRFAFST